MKGIYVCGMAHGPKLLSEPSLRPWLRRPGRHVPLQSEITLSVVTARVDQERCASCLICVACALTGYRASTKKG